MKRMYGFPMKAWNEAKKEAFEILQGVAAGKGLITYGDLAQRVTAVTFKEEDLPFALPHLIGELSMDEDAVGRGLISALVVNSVTNVPGNGFFELAEHLGRDTEDRDACFIGEVNRLYEEWGVRAAGKKTRRSK